jgi:hypothetical protein
MKDYLSLYESQKTVEYFGLILTIPESASYLATDDDGAIFIHSHEPELDENVGYWYTPDDIDAYCYMLCKVNLNNIDWKTTLKEIK